MDFSPPSKSGPKDVFLHLLAVATLYMSAIGTIMLMFQYVDYYLPDPLNPYYSSDPVRWAIALLIIIFPVHILTTRLLQKEFIASPEKREGKLRKWLLYFTLFIASVALIGDLVALVYQFLGGELSARFLFKVLAVGIVAGGIFGYYLWELRRKTPEISSRAKLVLRSVSFIVGLIVAGGLVIAGSPFAERERKFDDRRLSDLQNIQYQIVNYWQQKDSLPPTLDALKDEISGFLPPRDPETSNSYEYKTTGTLSFELCATFNQPTRQEQLMNTPKAYPMEIGVEIWNHEAGRVCFTRTIDPELYRLKDKGQPVPLPAR